MAQLCTRVYRHGTTSVFLVLKKLDIGNAVQAYLIHTKS